MLEAVTRKIICFVEKSNSYDEKNLEIYEYGIKQGILLLINLLTAFIIGIILNSVLNCFIFMTTYIILRRYSGGYHAKTQLSCYLLSIPLISISLLAIEHLPQTGFVLLGMAGAAGVIIFLLSPAEDRNKPLDEMEKNIYGKRARIILVLEEFLILLLFHLGFKEMALCVTVALVVAGGMVVMGKIR